MKNLCVVTTCLLLGSYLSPQALQSNTAGRSPQQKAAPEKPVTERATPTQPPADAPNEFPQSTHRDNPIRVESVPPVTISKDWLDCAILVLTAILACVGIVGTYVALRTLKAIEEQAKLMKTHAEHLATLATAAGDNAEAARLKAQADINAERAWVVAELRCTSRQSKDGRWYHPDGGLLTLAEVLAGKHLLYSLKLTNMGRTPAQIHSFHIANTCLPGIAFDCPAEGQLLQTHEFNHFLAGGEGVEIAEPIIDVNRYMQDFRDAISRNEQSAIFHGWVRYRHVFSTIDCHVDLCYVYIVKENRLSSFGRHNQQR